MAVTVDTSKTGIASNLQVLSKSAVAVSGASDLLENVLATITIPAGAMGSNGVLRGVYMVSCTNNANVKTVRLRLGGIGGTIFKTDNLASAPEGTFYFQLANRGASNSQVGMGTGNPSAGGWGTNGAALVTGAIDTSAATTIVITGQKATAGDTLTLDSHLVEMIPG